MENSVLRVGKYEVIHTTSYLQPNGEEAVLHVPFEEGTAKFRIRFLVNDAKESSQDVTFESEPDPEDSERALLTFTNWNKPFPMFAPEVTDLFSANGRDVFLVWNVIFGALGYHITLQFMREHKND